MMNSLTLLSLIRKDKLEVEGLEQLLRYEVKR
jgi:hypothetical protein